MKYGLIAAVLFCAIAARSVAQLGGEQEQDPFKDLKNVHEPQVSIPSDSFCGELTDAVSGHPVSGTLLELKPLSSKFETPHLSIETTRVGITAKSSRSKKNGSFDLRGANPGIYAVRVSSSPEGAWANVAVLRPTRTKRCRVWLRLNESDNSLMAVRQP